MQGWLPFGVLVFSSLSFVVACGGNTEGGGGSCGKVQPCGGNLVGTWDITATCIDTKAVSDGLLSQLTALTGCGELSLESSHADQTGTATFNADMTFTSTRTATYDATIAVPKSCITQGGFTLTCGQVNQLIAQFAGAQVGTVDCKDATGGCSCKLTTPSQTQTDAGNYSVSGTKITSGSASASGDYCVQGNELHIIALDPMSPDSNGHARILTDVVGKKR